MSSLATGATDTYLDVHRTLGVTDAELRRHHGVAADEPLRAAIAAALDSPTDDLLAAMAATGRVLDARGTCTPADCDDLAGALAHLGYVIECTGVGEDVAIDVYDRISGDVGRVRAEPSWDAVIEALAEERLGPVGIELVPLLDGRTLVIDARRLERLRVAYGPRVEPFETPLLPPEAADAVPEADGPGVVAGDWTGGAAAAERASASRGGARASADTGESPAPSAGDIVDADDGGGAGGAAVEPEALGGGPRRTVSTSGIDDVFDQLEDGTEGDEGSDGVARTTSTDDPLAGWEGPSADEDEEGHFAGGGPDRTVSRTSADDILERATGKPDFETVAAEHGDPDPDAVLDDGDEVSELAAAVSDVQSDPDVEEPDVDELIAAAEASVADEPTEILDDEEGEEAIADPERATDVLDDLGSTIGR